MKRFMIGAASAATAALIGMSIIGGAASVSAAPAAQPALGSPALAHGRGPNDGTHAGGKVASVSGSTITVTDRDGASKSILTTASTTVDLDGKAAKLGDLKAGMFVRAEGSTDAAGAFTATSVHASATQPQRGEGRGPNDGTHAGGKVASVSGSTITVTDRDGASKSILTTASTTVDLDGKAAKLGDLKAGMFVRAEGSTDAAGAFTATSVHASATQPQGHGGPGKGRGPGAPTPTPAP